MKYTFKDFKKQLEENVGELDIQGYKDDDILDEDDIEAIKFAIEKKVVKFSMKQKIIQPKLKKSKKKVSAKA